jgi:nickel-dependent lactate racemase
MRVELAYGRERLPVELPDDRCTVVEPEYVPGLADPGATLRRALAAPTAGPPLRDVVRPGQTVAISVCDSTRPQPREAMLRAIADDLAGIVRDEDVTVLIATGTHRPTTDDELVELLGPEAVERFRVLDHDARDPSEHVDLGVLGDGVPVALMRAWVEADVRITTGFVEPHFFAGFSGGPKMVAPGLAALETTLTLHDARRIGDPRAVWGITEGNPIHDDVRAIAAATGVHFALDVLINSRKEITHVFAGELFAEHRAACETARRLAMRPLAAPYDVVLTTNAGYPLDRNLYQAVKGMSAAALVAREGGTIVCAAECRDGVPGPYAELLATGSSPAELLHRIETADRAVPDQWQAQIQAKIQARTRVLVHAGGLADDDLRAAHVEPVDDVEAAVLDAAGRAGRICVLPEGPQTIPYLA